MSFFKVEETPTTGYDPEPLEEPETDGSESMEEVYDAEDSAAVIIPEATVEQKARPKRAAAKRRQGVSRMFVEAVSNNPGLTQSEYQRVLGLKSPIATMAKRLIERGIIRAETDGRFVRYYAGTTPYTEVRAGRKPKGEGKAKQKNKAKPKPSKAPAQEQDKGYFIMTVADQYGYTDRYIRLDGVWYELTPTDKPLF